MLQLCMVLMISHGWDPCEKSIYFNKYLMSTCYVAGATLGDRNMARALTQLSLWERQKTSCLTPQHNTGGAGSR